MTPNQRRAAQIQGGVYALVIGGSLYVLGLILDVPFTREYWVLAAVVAGIGFLAFRRYDLMTPWSFGLPGSVGRHVMVAWVFLVAGVLFLAYAFNIFALFSRPLLVSWIVLTPALLVAVHLAVSGIGRRFVPTIAMRRSAVLVFVNDSARSLARNLEHSPFYHLVGFFEDRETDRTGGSLEHVTYLGRSAAAADYVRLHHIQVVFVVLPDGANARVIKVLDDLSDTTASVYYVPDFFVFSLMQARISEIEGIPMLEVVETPFYGVDGVVKQLFDFAFALTVLVLLSPLLLLIGLAVKLESPGPAIYRQSRYGLDGQRFSVMKFRSMRVDPLDHGSRQATRDDPRITRIGRFLRRTSLDELPQFWNVLRGEMSVVGPRPHPVAFDDTYRKAVKRYMVRHKVKPGITGWAQVHGLRGETAQLERMEERIRYDIDYIRNWSPWLDFEIIARTVMMILRDEHAY